MLTVAYLANQLPSPTEHYVVDEIQELRQRGVRVMACSVTEPWPDQAPGTLSPEIVLLCLRFVVLCRALWILILRMYRLWPLLRRIFLVGDEGVLTRVKALAHTFLGACFAVKLQRHTVDHIHVHHGYFGSWIAMVAARLLDIRFSMTLHGSDLLLHGVYLDVKLEQCLFCLTISEYNRRFLFEKYPRSSPDKVLVSRLGVEMDKAQHLPQRKPETTPFTVLSVGRLHPTKDHAFLIRACAELRQAGVEFECLIAGDGPERSRLEALIEELALSGRVTLLSHVPRDQMGSLYERADLVVLTSRSEGIPLVLMEAMARGKIVLAPAITGIPELVIHGKTGFLFQAGSTVDFMEQLLFLHSLMQPRDRAETSCLNWIRHAAQLQIRHNFNRTSNLESFVNLFLSRVSRRKESLPHEDFVLQQI